MAGYVQIKDLPLVDTVMSTDQFVLQRADGILYKILGSSLITNIAEVVGEVVNPVEPTNYPGLLGWYQPSGLVSTGYSWASWTDSSGNGRDLVSYGQVSMRSINGLPAIGNGGGINGLRMERTSTGTEFTSSSYTFVTVLRGGVGDYAVRASTPDGSYIGQGYGGSPAVVIFRARDSNGLTILANAGSCDDAVIVVSTLNANTGMFTTYMNGKTYPSPHVTWKSTQSFQGTLKIGAYNSVTSDDAIAESFVYDSVRSNHEINNLCQKLATKFALTWINI